MPKTPESPSPAFIVVRRHGRPITPGRWSLQVDVKHVGCAWLAAWGGAVRAAEAGLSAAGPALDAVPAVDLATRPLCGWTVSEDIRGRLHSLVVKLALLLRRPALLLMLGSLAGCSGGLGQTFMVQFSPFSATPDQQGQATVQAAIAYAKANPLMPVTVDGFHYGQYSNEFDTMREERVGVVVSMFVEGGISRARIDILGKGIAYAQGSSMPSLPPETVRIGIGL